MIWIHNFLIYVNTHIDASVSGEMEVFQVLGPRCLNTSFTLSQEEAEMSLSDVFILLGRENELEAEYSPPSISLYPKEECWMFFQKTSLFFK